MSSYTFAEFAEADMEVVLQGLVSKELSLPSHLGLCVCDLM